jgi:drug/metabolite transporter (DMT)-like permease
MSASSRTLPIAGMAYAIAAMACFAVLDTTNKFLIASVPLLMVLWFRYAFQALASTAVMWSRNGMTMFQTQNFQLQMVRGLLLMMCSLLGFTSLKYMPVAEFTAFIMLTPLVVTALARFVMKEQVSGLRWLFVSGGLVGALLIVRPGGSMDTSHAWLPLSLVLSNAVFQILTSHMAKTESPVTMHLYTGWVGAIMASVMVAWGAWTTELSPFEWGLMIVIGCAGTFGHYLLILAFSRASAASVTPFLYSGIAFATFAGWLVFAHMPDFWACMGMVLIALCGLGAAWLSNREHRAS